MTDRVVTIIIIIKLQLKVQLNRTQFTNALPRM